MEAEEYTVGKYIIKVILLKNGVGISILKRKNSHYIEIAYLPPVIISNSKRITIKLPKYLIEAFPWIAEQPDLEVGLQK